MELSSRLTPQRVVLLSAQTKAEALNELVAVMAAADIGVGQDELARAVFKREALMSTGIGNGLAIPHVRLGGVTEAVMAVGVSEAGLGDYQSLDTEPVHIVVLIAAPQGQHEQYVRLLAEVSEVLRERRLRQAIVAADTAEAAYHILTRGQEQ